MSGRTAVRRSVLVLAVTWTLAALTTADAGAVVSAGSLRTLAGCDADAKVIDVAITAYQSLTASRSSTKITRADLLIGSDPRAGVLRAWPAPVDDAYRLVVAGDGNAEVGRRSADSPPQTIERDDALVWIRGRYYDETRDPLGACAALAPSPYASGPAGSTALENVVLSVSSPGFVEAPPGTFNGPLTVTAMQLEGLSSVSTSILQHVASGQLQTYVRLFVAPPSIDNSITIFALRFRTAADATSFVQTAAQGIEGAGTVERSSTVPVDDSVFTSQRLVLQGVPLHLDGALFSVGRSAFMIVLKSDVLPGGALVTLATRQARRSEALGGNGGTTSNVVLFVGVGALVVAMLVLFMLLRRAHRPRAVVASAVGPRVGRQAGWYPNTDNPFELRHWDGEQWTARRVLEGGKWVEGPLP